MEKRMIKKILIANRGEIACRIIRACKEMSIKSVSVYSDVDINSPHVNMADEAVCIGPASSAESYLKISNIIAAAEITNSDAIHPGYGFLAENAGFSKICKENKIKFITYLTDTDTKQNHWDSYFEAKDFGWNGVIKNLDLQEFIDSDFDALISYYKNDNLELNYATACSKAFFKIGLSNYDQNLNDFIIDINPNFVDIFGKELKKYLKGLNKIG